MNWKWGTAFGILVFITLVSIVFAFVQQTVASVAQREAESQHDELMKCKDELERQKAIVVRQMELYLQSQNELEASKKVRK